MALGTKLPTYRPFIPSGVPGPFLALQLWVTFPRRAPSCWPGATRLRLLPIGAAEDEDQDISFHTFYSTTDLGNTVSSTSNMEYKEVKLNGSRRSLPPRGPLFPWCGPGSAPPCPSSSSPPPAMPAAAYQLLAWHPTPTVRGESRDIGPGLSQRLVKLAFPCCGLLLHTSLCHSPDQVMQVPWAISLWSDHQSFQLSIGLQSSHQWDHQDI